MSPDRAERAEKWREIVAARPGFGDYEKKTTRTIPVLRPREAA